MKLHHALYFLLPASVIVLVAATAPAEDKEPLFLDPINIHPRPIAQDPSVKYDYDIVYVRTPRQGDDKGSLWTEIAHPALMDPGGDLMLLHPDGSEERLVEAGDDASITDPAVSLDGEWVYYSHIKGLKGTSQHGQPPMQGADIYKIHVKTRKIFRLTDQTFTPNAGAADWSKDYRTPDENKTWLNYGVLNMGPCPLPGGRLAFVSNRNAFRAAQAPFADFAALRHGRRRGQCRVHRPSQSRHGPASDRANGRPDPLQFAGVAGAAQFDPVGLVEHPAGRYALAAGHQRLRSRRRSQRLSLPDAAVRRLHHRRGVLQPKQRRFGRVSEAAAAPSPPTPLPRGERGEKDTPLPSGERGRGEGVDGYPAFGPADRNDPRNPPLRFGRFYNGKGKYYRLGFSPAGVESFTRFANNGEGPADPSVLNKGDSPTVGKFTHPAGAPDNNLLTVWTPGPANHQNGLKPPTPDGGIYLIKGGKPIDEPGQMLLIKNDPKYNEQWPRALVPYQRIYGIAEPKRLAPLANDGSLSRQLPEGTPFGLVGTSSLYKRESYPNGAVPRDGVTAGWAGGNDHTGGYHGLDPFNTSENGASLNWFNQGAEAGRYSNDDIVAIRILALEPTTDRNRGPNSGRLFFNHAMERMRILGEIPVRKFGEPGASATGGQPIDPDGNPDTRSWRRSRPIRRSRSRRWTRTAWC